MIRNTLLIATLLFVAFGGGSLAVQRIPRNFCTSDNKDPDLYCTCTSQHPDLCSSDDPMPSCCRTTEAKAKAKGCGCCSQKK